MWQKKMALFHVQPATLDLHELSSKRSSHPLLRQMLAVKSYVHPSTEKQLFWFRLLQLAGAPAVVVVVVEDALVVVVGVVPATVVVTEGGVDVVVAAVVVVATDVAVTPRVVVLARVVGAPVVVVVDDVVAGRALHANDVALQRSDGQSATPNRLHGFSSPTATHWPPPNCPPYHWHERDVHRLSSNQVVHGVTLPMSLHRNASESYSHVPVASHPDLSK